MCIRDSPSDARRKRLRVTPHGYELLTIGSALFDDVRERWAEQIGTRQLEALQAHLGRLVELRTFGAEDLARFDDADAAQESV